MTRQIVGSFDMRGRGERWRVARAFAPATASVVDAGPLQLAFTGGPVAAAKPLCLLDGYVDNALALAEELDTSVAHGVESLLAMGYRRWGRFLLSRLRGDFVLLIWDGLQHEGLIARDQLGVRSLYLHESHEGIRFASEVRDLLALLPQRPPPDCASVAHWIAVSNRPGSATMYEGVRRLDPGSLLLLAGDGVCETRYWSPCFTEPLKDSPEQLVERVHDALECAVARRLDSSGTTAVLMSGGLDSASVAALAVAQEPGGVWAGAGVFPAYPEVDEAPLIDELRSALMLPGLTAEVHAGGLLASALESLHAWELPLIAWGDFWMLPLLRRLAASGVRRTIGGDGGDELFGARAYQLADQIRAGNPRAALRAARELPGAGDRPPRRQVARVFAEMALLGGLPAALHNLIRRPVAGRQLPHWLRTRTAEDLLDSDDALAWKRLAGPRWWAHAVHGLTRGVEEAGVFEHQRRRAALAGLEARHPLFDLDLLELVVRLPPETSFDRYRSRPVLRASMAGALPDSVRQRPAKAWFDSLIVDCLSGPDRECISALLGDPAAELRSYIDIEAMSRALLRGTPQDRHERFTWMHQLWRLVTAESWLRAQAGRSSVPPRSRPSSARVDIRAVDIGAALDVA